MVPKDLVRNFYESDLANDEAIIAKFFHKDCELHWNSSYGFLQLKYSDIIAFFEETRKAYVALRFQISHLLEDGQFVISRHTLYANTIENSEEEIALGHFIAIWEVKDNKLYRCFEISQQADEKTLNSGSFNR